jgi:hypothetical protein
VTYRNVGLGFLTFVGAGMVVSSLPTTIQHLY